MEIGSPLLILRSCAFAASGGRNQCVSNVQSVCTCGWLTRCLHSLVIRAISQKTDLKDLTGVSGMSHSLKSAAAPVQHEVLTRSMHVSRSPTMPAPALVDWHTSSPPEP